MYKAEDLHGSDGHALTRELLKALLCTPKETEHLIETGFPRVLDYTYAPRMKRFVAELQLPDGRTIKAQGYDFPRFCKSIVAAITPYPDAPMLGGDRRIAIDGSTDDA